MAGEASRRHPACDEAWRCHAKNSFIVVLLPSWDFRALRRSLQAGCLRSQLRMLLAPAVRSW
jgi:hypothetical protein